MAAGNRPKLLRCQDCFGSAQWHDVCFGCGACVAPFMVGLGPCEGFHVAVSVWPGQCFRNFPKSEARTQLERLQADFMGVVLFFCRGFIGCIRGRKG